MRIHASSLLLLTLTGISNNVVQGFLVSPNARFATSISPPSNTCLFAQKSKVPDISKMKASEMRKELESYGIPTKSMLEKREFEDALKKARSEGKTPDNKSTTNTNSDDKAKKEAASPNGSSEGKEKKDEGSRDERYKTAFEKAKAMKVGDLKKDLQGRGISTKSFFEKSEFIKAYAEAVADNKTGSGSKKGGRQAVTQDEPFDASYHEVVMQKIDRRQLMGQSVIDVKLAR